MYKTSITINYTYCNVPRFNYLVHHLLHFVIFWHYLSQNLSHLYEPEYYIYSSSKNCYMMDWLVVDVVICNINSKTQNCNLKTSNGSKIIWFLPNALKIYWLKLTNITNHIHIVINKWHQIIHQNTRWGTSFSWLRAQRLKAWR